MTHIFAHFYLITNPHLNMNWKLKDYLLFYRANVLETWQIWDQLPPKQVNSHDLTDWNGNILFGNAMLNMHFIISKSAVDFNIYTTNTL